jgi:hypothetical protein
MSVCACVCVRVCVCVRACVCVWGGPQNSILGPRGHSEFYSLPLSGLQDLTEEVVN